MSTNVTSFVPSSGLVVKLLEWAEEYLLLGNIFPETLVLQFNNNKNRSSATYTYLFTKVQFGAG